MLMDNYNLSEIIRSMMNAISNVKVGQSGKVILEVNLLTQKIEGDKASKNNVAISEDNELVISHFKIHTDLTWIIENGNF